MGDVVASVEDRDVGPWCGSAEKVGGGGLVDGAGSGAGSERK